ncbi:MAG: YggT family protein [Dokdonella sp.]
MNYVANAGQLLVEVFFGAAIGLLILRVLLQLVRANFNNPICQFLYRVTNPVLIPMRRIIPAWRGLDAAGVLLAWLLTALKLVIVYAMMGETLGIAGLALMALADLIGLLLTIAVILIIVRIVLSFVGNGGSYHPAVPLVFGLTEPVLKPIRRVLPAPGGLDFSPMLAWLGILLIRMLVVQPLLDIGLQLAKGS